MAKLSHFLLFREEWVGKAVLLEARIQCPG